MSTSIEKAKTNAFCAVDPMPTWLVKDCLDVLKAALVKELINKKTLWTVIF